MSCCSHVVSSFNLELLFFVQILCILTVTVLSRLDFEPFLSDAVGVNSV